MTSSNPNGASISSTYDSLNRLSTVVDNRLGSGQNTTSYTLTGPGIFVPDEMLVFGKT
jgi:hypothetical protein